MGERVSNRTSTMSPGPWTQAVGLPTDDATEIFQSLAKRFATIRRKTRSKKAECFFQNHNKSRNCKHCVNLQVGAWEAKLYLSDAAHCRVAFFGLGLATWLSAGRFLFGFVNGGRMKPISLVMLAKCHNKLDALESSSKRQRGWKIHFRAGVMETHRRSICERKKWWYMCFPCGARCFGHLLVVVWSICVCPTQSFHSWMTWTCVLLSIIFQI